MFNSTLLSQVERKCNITWSDEDTTTRLTEIIENAIPDLIHRLGITDKDFDFSKPGIENSLFKSYCFYEWNHCLNEFFDNYSESIAQVRARNEVAQFLEREENTDAED